MTARRALLDGLARDADIFELVSELAPLHPRDNTFPGEVFIRVAADALDWCGARRADPLPLEGLRERFLPEGAFGGRETPSFSARCWSQQPSMAGPNRICWMRWPGGRPRICGSAPCSRRSPASAPPPAGRASQCARHARTWASALATRRHNGSPGHSGSGHLTVGRPSISAVPAHSGVAVRYGQRSGQIGGPGCSARRLTARRSWCQSACYLAAPATYAATI